MGNELMGVAPQKLASAAAGVSLAQTERNFLDALVSLAASSLSDPSDPDDPADDDPSTELPADDIFAVVVPTDYIPNARAKKPYEKKPRANPTRDELVRLGRKAGLEEGDVDYIRYWVVERDMDEIKVTVDREAKRMFRNPVIRRIINAAASLGLCNGTTATKDEIADFYTRRMRCEVLPEAVRTDAADKLAKLMGYNPKGEGGQGSVTVQINCIDPYATPPKAEVVDA